ncbi:MAG: glycoside hydrolase family 127 protein, partial [Firmicutes bacterium]|nr:glycoside hydrolase family 127 protein [Bacillota bacterium]
ETCAAIGLVFFAKRMLQIEPKSEYADVMERALYNGVISGMTLDGTRFFYVNPLEVVPEACEKDEAKSRVKVERQKWFGCACCPPNLARLMSSLPDYAYGKRGTELFVHLYLGGELVTDLAGMSVKLNVKTQYPWDGSVKMMINPAEEKEWTLALRVPGWCRNFELKCNGQEVPGQMVDGYYYITRTWKSGDELEYVMGMPVEMVKSNPRVRENLGKTALMRGPIVYCLEEADNGADLHRIRIGKKADYTIEYQPQMLDGIVTIQGKAKKLAQENWDCDTLYSFEKEEKYEEKELLWIPYYAWANRSAGELMVWIPKED